MMVRRPLFGPRMMSISISSNAQLVQDNYKPMDKRTDRDA